MDKLNRNRYFFCKKPKRINSVLNGRKNPGQNSYPFQRDNPLTIPVYGTGSAGTETCSVKLVELGDWVMVCVNGVFGTRMSDIVNLIGGRFIRVDGD